MNAKEQIFWLKGYIESLLHSDEISKEQIEIIGLNFDKLIVLMQDEISDDVYREESDSSIEDDLDFMEEPEQIYNYIEKESPGLTCEDFDISE